MLNATQARVWRQYSVPTRISFYVPNDALNIYTSKYIYNIFIFPSHLLSSPFYYLSLLVVTQIRGHIAGSFPPLPTTVRALHFYREKISALSSLVDSRRIVLTHARRSQQLILLYFCIQIQNLATPGFELTDQH